MLWSLSWLPAPLRSARPLDLGSCPILDVKGVRTRGGEGRPRRGPPRLLEGPNARPQNSVKSLSGGLCPFTSIPPLDLCNGFADTDCLLIQCSQTTKYIPKNPFLFNCTNGNQQWTVRRCILNFFRIVNMPIKFLFIFPTA
jgi:hypothetical protein